AKPYDRASDLYALASRSQRRRATPAERADAGGPRKAAPQATRSFAGSLRAAGRQALHAPVAAQFLHRHTLLPAGFVHDEVQPARLQSIRDAAGVPRASSARAGG